MTHDELLAEIDSADEYNYFGGKQLNSAFGSALRAVVELHKPELVESGKDSIFVCSTCNPEWFWENPYPCPTIQAIEKALS